MLVKMVKTKRGKERTRVEVGEYTAGETYNMDDELAKVFVAQGWAVETTEMDVPATEAMSDNFFDDGTNELPESEISDKKVEDVQPATRGRKKGTK